MEAMGLLAIALVPAVRALVRCHYTFEARFQTECAASGQRGKRIRRAVEGPRSAAEPEGHHSSRRGKAVRV